MLIHGTYVYRRNAWAIFFKVHIKAIEFAWSLDIDYPDNLKVLKLNHHKTNNIKMIIIPEQNRFGQVFGEHKNNVVFSIIY